MGFKLLLSMPPKVFAFHDDSAKMFVVYLKAEVGYEYNMYFVSCEYDNYLRSMPYIAITCAH